jgi:hypothetical protein
VPFSVFSLFCNQPEVFHIGVTELFGSFRGRLIGIAGGATTISDDERFFVLGQDFGELGLVGIVVNRSRNMAFFPRIRAVDIDHRYFLGFDGCL